MNGQISVLIKLYVQKQTDFTHCLCPLRWYFPRAGRETLRKAYPNLNGEGRKREGGWGRGGRGEGAQGVERPPLLRWLFLVVNLIQLERASAEESPPSDWPVTMSVALRLLVVVSGPAHCGWPRPQWLAPSVGSCIKKLLNTSLRASQQSFSLVSASRSCIIEFPQ